MFEECSLGEGFSLLPGAALGVADLDGDGIGEIVAGIAVPGAGTFLTALNARGHWSGATPTVALGMVPPSRIDGMDLTGDRVADLLVSGSPGGFGRVVVIDGATGNIVREQITFDPLFGSKA